jgi:hypothetical protein
MYFITVPFKKITVNHQYLHSTFLHTIHPLDFNEFVDIVASLWSNLMALGVNFIMCFITFNFSLYHTLIVRFYPKLTSSTNLTFRLFSTNTHIFTTLIQVYSRHFAKKCQLFLEKFDSFFRSHTYTMLLQRPQMSIVWLWIMVFLMLVLLDLCSCMPVSIEELVHGDGELILSVTFGIHLKRMLFLYLY